jgi:hypothetical protein
LVVALLLPPTAGGSAKDTSVDLELVLAIDASSSVDETEWALQQQGYAAAFRDERVLAAIRSGPNKSIAVAVLVWADSSLPKWGSDWFILSLDHEAERFGAFPKAAPASAPGSPWPSASSTATDLKRRARWSTSPATGARRRRARMS